MRYLIPIVILCLAACEKDAPELAEGGAQAASSAPAFDQGIELVYTVDDPAESLAVVETFRRRVEALKTQDPVVSQRASDVVVQLRGLPERCIEPIDAYLSQRAELRFLLMEPDEALRTRIFTAFVESLPEPRPPTRIAEGELRFSIESTAEEDREQMRKRLEAHTKLEPHHRLVFELRKGSPREPPYWAAHIVQSNTQPIVTGEHLAEAFLSTDPQFNQPGVSMVMTPEGTELFHTLTRDHVGEKLAILLDDRVVLAPKIREPMPEGKLRVDFGYISDSPMLEATAFERALQSGSLESKVTLKASRHFPLDSPFPAEAPCL